MVVPEMSRSNVPTRGWEILGPIGGIEGRLSVFDRQLQCRCNATSRLPLPGNNNPVVDIAVHLEQSPRVALLVRCFASVRLFTFACWLNHHHYPSLLSY